MHAAVQHKLSISILRHFRITFIKMPLDILYILSPKEEGMEGSTGDRY